MKQENHSRGRLPLAKLGAVGSAIIMVVAASCSAPEPPISSNGSTNPVRYRELHELIRNNFHYNFECWCTTATPTTVQVVKLQVSQRDIPVLGELIADSDDRVSGTAISVLTKFGPLALPVLRRALASPDPKVVGSAVAAISDIEDELGRQSSTPSR